MVAGQRDVVEAREGREGHAMMRNGKNRAGTNADEERLGLPASSGMQVEPTAGAFGVRDTGLGVLSFLERRVHTKS